MPGIQENQDSLLGFLVSLVKSVRRDSSGSLRRILFVFKRKAQAVDQRRMEGWKNSAALELSWRGGPPDDGE